MKATDLLRQQHRQVEALFAQIEAGRPALLSELASLLAAHMTIEHEFLYPEARETDERAIAEAFEEHALAEVALKRALSTDPADEAFGARVRVLKDLVLHHVHGEESRLFREIEAETSPEDLTAMGRAMASRFTQLRAVDYASLLASNYNETAAYLAQAAAAE